MHVDFIALLKQLITETQGGQTADHLFFGDKRSQPLNAGEITLINQIGESFAHRDCGNIIFFFQHGFAVNFISGFQSAGFDGFNNILFDLEILSDFVFHTLSLPNLIC